MNYIVDVREEEELKTKRLISKNPNIKVINVPTSIIKSQVDFVNSLSKKGKVYLGCRRGIRTNKIKNELFDSNPNVISIDAIDNAPILFSDVVLLSTDSSNLTNSSSTSETPNPLVWLLAGLGLFFGLKLIKN